MVVNHWLCRLLGHRFRYVKPWFFCERCGLHIHNSRISVSPILGADSVWEYGERRLSFPTFDSTYPTVTCTSSTTAGAFGAWVQAIADVGVNKMLYGIVMTGYGIIYSEVEVGEGSSGNEKAIARVNSYCSTTASFPFFAPAFKRLTDNARISVRARDSSTSAITYAVGLLVGDA
jgi:hypothetical protein